MKEIYIDGVVQIPVNQTYEEFYQAFIEWVESKGYQFGGGTGELDSEYKLPNVSNGLREFTFIFNKGEDYGKETASGKSLIEAMFALRSSMNVEDIISVKSKDPNIEDPHL